MFWMISHWTSAREEGEHYVMTSRAETGGEKRKKKRESEQKLEEERAGDEGG